MAWAVNRPADGTAYSLPDRLFPADNWWNLNVSAAPLDARSSALIDFCAGGAPDLGGNPALDLGLATDWGNNYGMPYCTVSGDHPTIVFAYVGYSGGASGDDTRGFPIPAASITEAGWTEDLAGTIAAPKWLVSTGSFRDRHLLIFDVDNQYLYEIYQPYYNATASPQSGFVDPDYPEYGTIYPYGESTVIQPGTYACQSCSFWDAKTNASRPEGVTSSDAAGLQVLPGLVKYDEIIGGLPITHAHRMCLYSNSSDIPKYVWPATHEAGSWTANHPPLGTRFRLKSSYNATGEYAVCQTFIQSLKDYGLIFVDRGGHGQITGTNDTRWGSSSDYPRVQLVDTISRIDFADLEVVQLGWNPPSVPVVGPGRPIDLTSATWTGAATDLADSSDTTYIESPATPTAVQTFTCTLQAVTTPTTTVTHQVRVRAATVGTDALDLVLALENTDDDSVVATRTQLKVPTTLADQLFVLNSTEVARIHSYAGLRVRGYAYVSGDKTYFVWTAVPTATSYLLQIRPSASPTYDTFNSNVGNVLTYGVALPTGSYYSRVVPYVGGTALTPTAEQAVTV
ncbi:MAG: hypothetical protein MUF84_12075 [Anaerolineae bacterium]|jgi:hypothetical protein|nr:hypothetical protein [Anaerolineae bacterium]